MRLDFRLLLTILFLTLPLGLQTANASENPNKKWTLRDYFDISADGYVKPDKSPSWQLKLQAENDTMLLPEWMQTDRFYTQGFMMEGKHLGVVNQGRKVNYGWSAGQLMFTPTDLSLNAEEYLKQDRPYAGWLYFGRFREEFKQNGDAVTYKRYELQIGAIGQNSLAGAIQRRWHLDVMDAPNPMGWPSQIGEELGVLLHYEKMWDLSRRDFLGFKKNLVFTPVFKVNLGNIFTDVSGGLRMKLGILESPLEPQEKGKSWFKFKEAYLYANGDGKFVLHNATLEGGLFNKSFSGNGNSNHIMPQKRYRGSGRLGLALNLRRLSLKAGIGFITPEVRKVRAANSDESAIIEDYQKYSFVELVVWW